MPDGLNSVGSSYRLSMVKLQREVEDAKHYLDESYRLSMVKLQLISRAFTGFLKCELPLEHGEVATPKRFFACVDDLAVTA